MKNPLSYEAALKNAAYFYQPDAGFLRLGGTDRIDFLQRQTTNDLRQLNTDRALSTVLTSPTARILDVFLVIDEGESLGIVTLPGRFPETSKFLRSRIFFSDQVTVDDLSTDFAQILLLGPQVDNIMEKLILRPPASGQYKESEIASQAIRVISQEILMAIGYRILVPIKSIDTVIAALAGAGAVPMDAANFDLLRVEAGQPGSATELVDTYTPLEMQLRSMISDSKGCYTGQEIIARQITYDKVTKSLVGIKLNMPVEIDAKVEVGGKLAGTVTSVAQSPRFGDIALGILRRQYRAAGTAVSIRNEDDSVTTGEVVDLPFR